MFDPSDLSKMDPQVLMELSRLLQDLPPDQVNRMQSLMHNMMAGFDVQKDMEEFEKTLPPGFRQKMTALMMKAQVPAASQSSGSSDLPGNLPGNLKEARLTLLRAVAAGKISPEEAEKLL